MTHMSSRLGWLTGELFPLRFISNVDLWGVVTRGFQSKMHWRENEGGDLTATLVACVRLRG